jgi:HSP20 family protein
MPLARGGNAHPLSALHEEMNRLFEDFWRDFDTMPNLASGRALGWPSIDVSESDKEIKIVAEVPGVEEKDLEVVLDNGMLCIRGEKKGETQDQNRRLSERYYGRFERRIPLDAEVQEDKVTASFKQGVLTIALPKSDQAAQKSKRIQITH